MYVTIYEWLDETKRSRWVCAHIAELLGFLQETQGNSVKSVGLCDPKVPEAVVFLTKPLNDVAVRVFVEQTKSLRLDLDGVGNIYAVYCSEHQAVSVRFADRPM